MFQSMKPCKKKLSYSKKYRRQKYNSEDLGVSNLDARVQILKRIKAFLSGNCKPKKSGK